MIVSRIVKSAKGWRQDRRGVVRFSADNKNRPESEESSGGSACKTDGT
jgi:hypothetical protein